jgi:ATP-binding cassette, subfamily B, bacterial
MANIQMSPGSNGADPLNNYIYIARALLQNAAVLILDESFAALDPETLQRVQQCVLEQASTLLVIAHP